MVGSLVKVGVLVVCYVDGLENAITTGSSVLSSRINS